MRSFSFLPARAAASAGLAVFFLVTSTACSSEDGSAPAVDANPTLSSSSGSLGSAASGGPGISPAPGAPAAPGASPAPATGTVEVLGQRDHDPAAFTQGLELHDGVLYESTGMYNTSWVSTRPADGPATSYTAQVSLPPQQFGEGMTVTSAGTLWQITWRDQVAYKRDATTLAELGTVSYDGEGWGLCTQTTSGGERLVMSDGSATLTFRDPNTFAPTGTVTVTRDGQPVTELNELECVGDAVYANVWMTDTIVRIDPTSGAVTAQWDLGELQQPRPADPNAVLNGIAALPEPGTFLVTGKLWPTMYEVRLR